MDYLKILKTVLAFVPIIWLLVSLGKIKMPAHKAGVSALIITLLITLCVFKMNSISALQASAEGMILAVFPILWVILSALFVYNVTLETGSMDKIKDMLSGLSPDRRIQSLILAFSFGGFLEAVAGFGTAVAIPAGILAAMGFSPVLAATICLIANTIPVAFGVLGIPVITLAQLTGLSLTILSIYTAVQLIPFIILLPLVLVFAITGSFKNIKGIIGVSLTSGLAFAFAQTLTAMFVGPELAAVAGSLFSLVVIVVWVKVRPVKNVWLFKSDKFTENLDRLKADNVSSTIQKEKIIIKDALVAWSPYILILVIILATRFVPFLDFLNEYPFVLQKQFYFGEGGKPLTFQLATGGGTVLFVSALVGGIIQGATYKRLLDILVKTLKQISKTIVTVSSIVILAKIMGYSGMVNSIANTLAGFSGKFYPLISPFIGALGTFITGSDTSSNVLFGNLQKQTALQIGSSQEWIVAANASGATAGKMISPQSIAIATAATGLSGSEGKLMGTTIKYCLIYVLVLGVLVMLFSLN